MPSASSKLSMSIGELATCEDFLESHRLYALDLLFSIEKVCQWHSADSCPETRSGRTCTLCELCSADGLMGATKKALTSYDDAEKHLKAVRASLGKNALSYGEPGRETLFTNKLAKAVFFSIINAGDALKAQHAGWQTRLQSQLATSSSAPHISAALEDILLLSYSGTKMAAPESNPKLTAGSTGSIARATPSSNMFVVFRRCLSSDCPCEANKANRNATSKANSRNACGSQVASSSSSGKTRTAKSAAKSQAITGGAANHTVLSTTTNLERPSKKTSGPVAKTNTNAQTQRPSTYRDPNGLDARAQDVVLEGHTSPSPASETALCTPESESSSELLPLIEDPRVFRLRAQITRSDDARRALMEWCWAWMTDLQSVSRERHMVGPIAPLMHQSRMKNTRGYPCGLETVELGKSLCTGQVEELATKGLPDGDDATDVQESRFNAEQEEFKERWLMARQKRCKGRKGRPSGIDHC